MLMVLIINTALGALLAHVIEICFFAFAYFFMIQNEQFGTLSGNFQLQLMDCAYFSFTTYTILGYGDLVPHGDVRFPAGLESLTGLVFITWTASFLFFEMQKYWTLDE